MADNLKNNILKAVDANNKTTNNKVKKPVSAPVFKKPQLLQHSLDKSLQTQKETGYEKED